LSLYVAFWTPTFWLTEDMQTGAVVGCMRIVNPFAG